MLKVVIIIAGILALYALFSIMRIVYIAKKAANPEIQHSEITLGSGPLLRYSAAGDSTSVGIGTKNSRDAYPSQVSEFLGKRNMVVYKNIGVTGAKTKDVLEKQLQSIIDFRPDIVTLSVGANNETHLQTSKNIIGDFELIIDRLTKETSATIYIANIPDFTGTRLFPWWFVKLIEHNSKAVNRELLKFSNERVKIVPIHDLGPVELSGDLFHPNEQGYKKWAGKFLEIVTEQ